MWDRPSGLSRFLICTPKGTVTPEPSPIVFYIPTTFFEKSQRTTLPVFFSFLLYKYGKCLALLIILSSVKSNFDFGDNQKI